MNLERAAKEYENVKIEDKARKRILDFAESHFKPCKKSRTTWNERQIRNATQTAIALAEYPAQKATKKWGYSAELRPYLE